MKKCYLKLTNNLTSQSINLTLWTRWCQMPSGRILFFRNWLLKLVLGTRSSNFKNKDLTTIKINTSLTGLLRSTILTRPHITTTTPLPLPTKFPFSILKICRMWIYKWSNLRAAEGGVIRTSHLAKCDTMIYKKYM